MSRQNLQRFPSLRSNLIFPDRRESKEYQASQALQKTIQQSELAKRIQNKFKMRKKSCNTNSNNLTENTQQSIEMNFEMARDCSKMQFYDQNINLIEEIDKTWDSDLELIEKTMNPLISRKALKQLIVRDKSLIMCYLNRGQKLSEILINKGEKLAKSETQRCKIYQKQKDILANLDSRIKKLQAVL